MKRIACLVALMALSSPACARGSYSFTFHGHRVHIAAHCRSLSCISVSGIGDRRDRDNDVATTSAPAPAPAPAQVPAAPAPPPQAQPAPAQPPAAPARPTLVTAQAQAAPVITRGQTIPPVVQNRPAPQPAAATAPTLAAASNRPAEITSSTPSAPPPAVGFDTAKPLLPAAADQPQVKPATAQSAVPVVRVSKQAESAVADSPLGDWQTDGKNGGLVHIEACGTALCGYTLDPSTRTKGETILVNMKPKNDTKWTGNVYSRTSGNSYYGTMTLKQGDTLRVEACALGQFFCSGNNWTRVIVKPDELVSSQHVQPEPRS
jgi:uncharacterized protein (DUF2147 family)